MLTTFMNEMKEFASFTRERAPVPTIRLNVPDTLPPTGLASAESLSVLASDGAWEEEEFEGDTDLLSSSLVSGEIPMPSLRAEIVLPSPPETAPLTGPPGVPATLPVPDETLFPAPPVMTPSPLVEQVPGLLQSIKREFHVGIRVRPLPPGGPASRRSLGAAGVVVPPSARWEFPMDPSILTQFQRWSRGNLRDWSSYNRDQNTAIQVFDTDFEAVLRVPDIPPAVWNVLLQPPVGPPKATFSAARGYRLKDAEAQRREDSLRAIDRANRMAIKCQALAQWAAEALTEVLKPSPLHERTDPLLQGLGCLSEATVDQLARSSVRLVAERRELLFPLLGLSEATVADLRRLPLEGPDLFAGHFEHVLARQAERQDTLKRNLKFVSKSRPQQTSVARYTAPRARGRQQRRGPPASASRPPASATAPVSHPANWSGGVTVSRGGQRSFSSSAARGGRKKRNQRV